MNKLNFILCFLIVSIFSPLFSVGVFAGSGKTLQELGENIYILEEQSSDLDKKWEDFRNQNGDIANFLKTPLSDEEKIGFESIVSKYNGDKNFLEQDLVQKLRDGLDTTDTKIKLIELKKQYYKDIIPYISAGKMETYLDFIRSDVELNEKNKEVKESIYKDKVILQEKVDTLREKIAENNKVLESRIEETLKNKIAEKVQSIKKDARFTDFTLEQKAFLFQKTLERIIEKRRELENERSLNTLIEKKIAVYKLVESAILQEIRSFIE